MTAHGTRETAMEAITRGAYDFFTKPLKMDEFQVVVALPGARAEEVVVQITPIGLQIETMVPPPSLSARANVVRLEIPYGRMRRRIDLPPCPSTSTQGF